MSRLSDLLKPSGDFGEFHWQINTWSQLREGATTVREAVFINEQRISREIEFDELDVEAVQILVTDKDGTPVATARMLAETPGVSRLGRMGVVFNHRGSGLGKLMVTELMQFARRRRDKTLMLHAQSAAMGFYKKLGFVMEGEPFMDAGIPHIKMSMTL